MKWHTCVYQVLTFGYHLFTGPNKWNLSWPDCTGHEQSPIDIDTHNVWYSSSMTSLEMVGYESIPPNTRWELVNVGHAGNTNVNVKYGVNL